MKIYTKRNHKSILYFSILALLSISLFSTSCKHPEQTENENQNESSENSYTPVDDSDLENMSALQFTKMMGNGINLGNTMEATSGSYPGFNSEDASIYETMWGQPVTKKEMFEAMKAAGFDSVRIPVAWTNTMDWSKGDFEINENYLKRVETVVNYALDSGLFVMINDHWDYGWWGMFSHDEDTAWKIYKSIWTQVGNYFKDYDYRLIFEGGNEELGERLNDAISTSTDSRLTDINYSQGTLTEAQCYELTNRINQEFVDIIRGQGSKNEKRFLLIPGFDTNIQKTCNSSYKMPEDSSNSVNKLIVSVHYYSPAIYAIADNPSNSWGYSDTWGSEQDIKDQNAQFLKMKKFVNDGYGVIIGEYGCALIKGKSRKNGDVEWITNILDNCDKYNYAPFLWDCNTYFKKNGTIGFIAEDVADIYSGRNYESEKDKG